MVVFLVGGDSRLMDALITKMEKDGLIQFVREKEKRKLYRITDLGQEVLTTELKRIERLYRNIKGMEP